jgi:dTDP-4-dehydrorhamnose 3,5-epimerase
MEIRPTLLPGCFELRPVVRSDERGSFVKTIHAPSFASAGLRCDFAEEFHSLSKRGVIRGLHFQLPPSEHAKLVSCVRGEIFDAAVDLRRGSPTMGRALTMTLDDRDCRALYVAPGVAHGFQALSEEAVVLYRVTSVHSPSEDAGVRWDSAGVDWPLGEPLLSERDRGFPALSDFESPFRHGC